MSQTICFHAYRGGTGKSHLVANIALQLARRGKRIGVIDADLYNPGQHILFNLPATAITQTLDMYLRGDAVLPDVVYHWEPCAISAPGALYLVPARNDANAIGLVWREGYDLALLHDTFTAIGKQWNLDYVLVDTHPGLDLHGSLLTAASTDLLYLTLRPDTQDINGTQAIINTLENFRTKPTFVLVNKSPRDREVEQVITGLNISEHLPLVEALSISRDLVHHGSEGLFSLEHPEHPWSQGISRIADHILQQRPII